MHDIIALASSLVLLGLVSAIYYCNIVSRPNSWLRNETLAMVLLSLFTGLLPLAITATLTGFWQAMTGGLTVQAMVTASTDLGAVAALLATGWIFRATVKATYRNLGKPGTVTPLTPTPANLRGAPSRKLAA